MSVAKARSRVAHEVKKVKKTGGDPAGPQVQAARRDLAEEKIRQYVEQVVAAAPPLTDEQRLRLSALFQNRA